MSTCLEPAAKRPHLGSSSSNAASSQVKNIGNLPSALIAKSISFLDASALLSCEKVSKNFAAGASTSKPFFQEFDLTSLKVLDLARLFPLGKTKLFLHLKRMTIAFNFFEFVLKNGSGNLDQLIDHIPQHCLRVTHLCVTVDSQSYCKRMLTVWGKTLKTLELQCRPSDLPCNPAFPDVTSREFTYMMQGYLDAMSKLPDQLAELRQICPMLEQYTVQGTNMLAAPAAP